MKKRLFALMLVMVMTVSVMTACGNNDKNDEPITLTVYSQLANYSGEMTGWFAQIMLERFNVKLLIVPETGGVYDTRMEAGNLGDIVIWGSDGENYQAAVEAGLLFDWNEDGLLSEYGPYIEANMPNALQKNMDISGGTLYGFGHAVATSNEDHQEFFYTWDLRWDLYKQLGYPEVNNYEDYLNMLIDMKEISPVDETGNPTYAISMWPDWDGNMVMYVKAMATAYYGYDELALGLYNPETSEFYDALQLDGPYLESLKFFNDLYQNDLLDPDSMTQTFDEATAKVKNGGTFFSIFNYSGSDAFNSDEHMEAGQMMLPMSPNDATPITYGMSTLGGNRVWSIGAKTQYPELCMEILNWFCTPEGRMTTEYGPEGITWYYDEAGNTYATELGVLMHNERDTEFPEESGYYGTFSDGSFQLNNVTWALDSINPDSNGEKYNWDSWKSNHTEAKYEIEQDWRTYTGVTNEEEYMENRDYKLAIGSAFAEGGKDDELKLVWEQVTKTIVDYSWKAIYADTDEEYDAVVAEMIEIANGFGYDMCLEWSLNEAANRKAAEDAVK